MNKTFYCLWYSVLLFCIPYTSCSLQADSPIKKNETIKKLISDIVKQEKIPGCIAAISDNNGLLLIESAGVRKNGEFKQITNNDLFHLGSCTKAITGMLIGVLIEKGLLGWESTIIETLPETKSIIDKKFHHITLHQLLTHRGGIPANAKNWWAFENQGLIERRLSILKENLENPNKVNTGEKHYSNLGYMIAGCMAERVTGKTWEALMQDFIFKPLGMQSAGFGPPETSNMPGQPWGHKKFEGKWLASQSDNAEALGPAGRVHCTIADWSKFIAVLLAPEKNPILKEKTAYKITSPEGDYACGWTVVPRSWAKGLAFTHAGSNTMWYVVVWVAPGINRAFYAGTNSAQQNTGQILDKIIWELIQLNHKFHLE